MAAFRRFEVNNNKKVEQKLVKAFLLASHGEFESAAKEASLVAKNTKDKNLGKLLSTHLDVFKNLNENSTNKKEISKNYFKQLTAESSTAFVGHLALMRQAILDKKDINEILEEAEKAIKFEPKSKQILEVLLFSYAKIPETTVESIFLGLTTSLINPKILIFFTSIFSQFISQDYSIYTKIGMALLAGIIDSTWYILVCYSISIKVVKNYIKSKQKLIFLILGTILIIVSFYLAFKAIRYFILIAN